MLPTIIFLIAALVSFSTGTSWATMTILTPIGIPLVFEISQQAALTGAAADAVLLSSIAAIMAGSVFGDHCSPISDTTIMSSMACAADHIDHVRTQIPYALTVALVAILLGYLPSAFQIPSVFVLLLCGVAILGIILLFGKPNETDEILK
jgi:Na+/H+ antiporter NhaC